MFGARISWGSGDWRSVGSRSWRMRRAMSDKRLALGTGLGQLLNGVCV